jgi:hypothetical protein
VHQSVIDRGEAAAIWRPSDRTECVSPLLRAAGLDSERAGKTDAADRPVVWSRSITLKHLPELAIG